jgi:hypothetical protein
LISSFLELFFKKVLVMDKNRSPLLEKPDYLVCTCMEVMYSQIVEEIKAGTTTYNELSERLGVGTGCSSCVDEVKQILQETLEGE